MPGSPYIENPQNILTWKKILPWILFVPSFFITAGFLAFNSIGAISGGAASMIALWILSRKFSHK